MSVCPTLSWPWSDGDGLLGNVVHQDREQQEQGAVAGRHSELQGLCFASSAACSFCHAPVAQEDTRLGRTVSGCAQQSEERHADLHEKCGWLPAAAFCLKTLATLDCDGSCIEMVQKLRTCWINVQTWARMVQAEVCFVPQLSVLAMEIDATASAYARNAYFKQVRYQPGDGPRLAAIVHISRCSQHVGNEYQQTGKMYGG